MADPAAARRLFRHARREALVTLGLWAVAFAWTVGFCYLRGYRGHDPDSWLVRSGWAIRPEAVGFHQVLGLPDWVCYGILLPWLGCSLFTAFFCVFGMTDDDLGPEATEGVGHGH